MDNNRKTQCGVCKREVTRWQFTAYLHAHKITREQHAMLFPFQAYTDGWCPGGRHTTRHGY